VPAWAWELKSPSATTCSVVTMDTADVPPCTDQMENRPSVALIQPFGTFGASCRLKCAPFDIGRHAVREDQCRPHVPKVVETAFASGRRIDPEGPRSEQIERGRTDRIE
jgi:hypothetical protein